VCWSSGSRGSSALKSNSAWRRNGCVGVQAGLSVHLRGNTPNPTRTDLTFAPVEGKSKAWFVPPNCVADWLAVLFGVVVACALLALVSWNVWRLAEGKVTWSELTCVDPTDACNWSSYRVVNDSRAPVVLRACSHHCGDGDRRLDPVYVEPGAVTPDDVYRGVKATVGSRDWWEVQTPSAVTLGCLVLDGHAHKRDGDLVQVSSAGSCGPQSPSTTSFAKAG
jgi:hypothetical protein